MDAPQEKCDIPRAKLSNGADAEARVARGGGAGIVDVGSFGCTC